MRSSDVPPSVPPRFVSFAWRYRRCARFFAPARTERGARGPWALTGRPTGTTPETVGPPRFLANPRVPATLLGPRRDLRAKPVRRVGAACATAYGASSRVLMPFGARSRGSFTPCVRFAAEVALGPRNTRFRVVAGLSRAGVEALQGSKRGFSASCFLLVQALPGANAATFPT